MLRQPVVKLILFGIQALHVSDVSIGGQLELLRLFHNIGHCGDEPPEGDTIESEKEKTWSMSEACKNQCVVSILVSLI